MAKLKNRRQSNRVREERAAYGAAPAKLVIMEGKHLDDAEQYMESLRAKAVSVSQALTAAGVPHGVIGGMAVLAHLRRVDRFAWHTTRDLDMLMNRADLDRAAAALRPLGFSFRRVMGIPAFLPPRDPDKSKPRFEQGVHLVWANERVRPVDPVAAPALEAAMLVTAPDGYVCVSVAALLRMKLVSFRLKDKVDVQDLLSSGLITKAVRNALPPELLARLKEVEAETERERLG